MFREQFRIFAVGWGGDDGVYREKSAKMLATLLFGMQGTPYIYQGQEIAMTNVRFPIEEYRDLEIKNVYRERTAKGIPEQEVMESIYRVGRDNARTPMQWDDSTCAGFTTGEPWISVNPNFQEINVKSAEEDKNSVFHYYQRLISLRKEYTVFTEGSFELLAREDEQIFAYTRQTGEEQILILCNMSGKPAEYDPDESWKSADQLISNEDTPLESVLKPWEARILLLQK
ncbi:MAG: alpha-amylase family glycosyl hydrolase [Clostridiales bacterium]|nr:alpha-amylase family glycosyl hydrolase [Clostridiales bacterium]